MKYNRTARPGSLATKATHYGKVDRDGMHPIEYAVRRTGDRSYARRYWFTWAWEPGKVVAPPPPPSPSKEKGATTA